MAVRKKLSTLDATLLVMGGIVGVGIFFTPHMAAQRAYEPWAFLMLWGIGGGIALCAAFTFAELGASFPRAGGWFVYLRAAYGPFPAFLFAWIVLFVVSTGATAVMVSFGADMLHEALPAWVGEPGSAGHGTAAALVVVGVTAVALTGVKRAALFQNLCMFVKLLALGALIVGGLVLASPGATPGLPAASPPEHSLASGILSAILPVLFACGGWQMLGYVAQEVEHPERTLPRAILLGIGGVVLVYLLANLSFLYVLGIDGLAADRTFAASIAERAFGPTGSRLLAGAMAVSALGVATVTIIATPWLYVAMAKEGLFFERFGALHPRTGVPSLALVVQALVTLVYLFAAGLRYLVDSVVFVEWIFHGLVAFGLIRLRRRSAELPRPYASPLFPLAPAVYALAALAVVGSTVLTAEPRLKYTGLAIVLVGALAYHPWRTR